MEPSTPVPSQSPAPENAPTQAPAPEVAPAPQPTPEAAPMQQPAAPQVAQTQPAAPAQPGQRDWLVALLLSIFVGYLGVDRFYMGYVGLGILKLITFGGFGIWTLIDIILIATNKLNDANGKSLHNAR